MYLDAWFLREAAICRQRGQEIDNEVVKAPVSGMFHLGDVLEFVIDGFYDGPLPEQQSVRDAHQRTLHVALQFRDELYAIDKQAFKEALADDPLSPTSLPL